MMVIAINFHVPLRTIYPVEWEGMHVGEWAEEDGYFDIKLRTTVDQWLSPSSSPVSCVCPQSMLLSKWHEIDPFLSASVSQSLGALCHCILVSLYLDSLFSLFSLESCALINRLISSLCLCICVDVANKVQTAWRGGWCWKLQLSDVELLLCSVLLPHTRPLQIRILCGPSTHWERLSILSVQD